MCDVIMIKPWKVLAFLNIALVAADVLVYPKADPFILLADYYDQEANFGLDIPKRGISTGVVVASNETACGPILPPPTIPNPPSNWAVLIKRYNCSFEDKVLNAQNAFYDVAIVHNVDSNALETMNASNPEKIHIMAIFISANTGKEIRTKYLYEHGFVVQIEPNSSSDILGKILIPFIIVISASFILMVGFMVVKCIKDHRRARRRRMPHSTLNKIPTTKYRKNDPYETCAICLDDFIEGEKLRVLPCSHAYHCKCIDPWLTRNRRVCPMCKRKVFAADERVDTDGSSSEDDDHTPLLRGRNAPDALDRRERLVARARQAEHMRRVMEAIQREREQYASLLPPRQLSSSGSSTSSASNNDDRSSGNLQIDFRQALDVYLNGSGSESHPEDHHSHPGHSQQPEPQRESTESANPEVQKEPLQPSHQSGRDSPQPAYNRADSAHHSDSHHEVAHHDDDTTHDSHHEVASHDSHYEVASHDDDTTHDSYHEVTFHDDTTHDSFHDPDC